MKETKEKILDAALDLFAQKGFAGTSISDIAHAAQTQKSLIYYYFKDKREVWHAVKEGIAHPFMEQEPAHSYESVRAFLETILMQRLAFYESDPRIERIMKWQMLEDPEGTLVSQGKTSPLAWSEAFKMFQDQEKISAKYSPQFLSVFLHSAISGAILDPLHVFSKRHKEKKHYVDMVIESFIKSFCG